MEITTLNWRFSALWWDLYKVGGDSHWVVPQMGTTVEPVMYFKRVIWGSKLSI